MWRCFFFVGSSRNAARDCRISFASAPSKSSDEIEVTDELEEEEEEEDTLDDRWR